MARHRAEVSAEKCLILSFHERLGNRGTSRSLDKVAAPLASLAGSLYNFGAIRATERLWWWSSGTSEVVSRPRRSVGYKRGQNHSIVVGIDRGDRSTEIGQGETHEDPREIETYPTLWPSSAAPLRARYRTRERGDDGSRRELSSCLRLCDFYFRTRIDKPQTKHTIV